MIIIGLGTVWILDGLEVTVIGSITGRVSATGSGVSITSAQIAGLGAALYVTGACVGASCGPTPGPSAPPRPAH
jgi:hypothetical protein